MMPKFVIGILVAAAIPTIAQAQDGATLFKNNCGMCHKLGTRLVGPDLSNVSQRRSKEWLHKFIKSSQSLVKSGDKEAVAIFNEFNQTVMPDQQLSDAQIDLILKYIDENSTTTTSAASTEMQKTTPEEKAAPPEEIITDKKVFAQLAEKGARLFDGRIRFQNGGPTCISCHNVNSYDVTAGGSLAKDLSDAYSRIGSDGLKGVLSGLPFPAMKSSFEKHPLTEEEIDAIVAFLKQTSQKAAHTQPFDYASLLTWGGIPGVLILLGIYSVIWYKRKKKTINQSIYSRQIKSI